MRGDLNVDGARQYLARFRFYGDDPLRKVGSLSGGESTRLALAKLLLEPRNLLFLDEPTNHLDIPAAEILEEALVGFDGTVILVSHDRRFLETVTTRTLSFTPDGIDTYEGGFKDYGDALERKRKADADVKDRAAARVSTAPKAAAKTAPKAGSHAPPATASAGKPDDRDTRKAATRDIEKKKKRVTELEKQIRRPGIDRSRASARSSKRRTAATDERLHDLARKDREYSELLDRAMKEWVTLSEEVAKVAGADAGAQK